MSKVRFTLNIVAAVIITVAASSMAHAQATRTWVSGVGDDVNPCSRTAPCKTFAGAISKTAAGGEIDALDPGGFGAVTITKSMTIDGRATMASILAAGTNGIIVNDSATGSPNTIVVSLRNLSIQGATTGVVGVRIISGKSVDIQNSVISGFRASAGTNPGRGISDERTGAGARLVVSNTNVHNNLNNAIVIQSATVSATLDGVRVYDNGLTGVFVGAGAKVTIRDSVISHNGNAGVQAADANTQVNILDSSLTHNTSHGVFVGAGASLVRLSNVTITNSTNGVNVSGGSVVSFGNNNVTGNTNNNTVPGGIGQQ